MAEMTAKKLEEMMSTVLTGGPMMSIVYPKLLKLDIDLPWGQLRTVLRNHARRIAKEKGWKEALRK